MAWYGSRELRRETGLWLSINSPKRNDNAHQDGVEPLMLLRGGTEEQV